jgi:predicted ABC-type ATPase
VPQKKLLVVAGPNGAGKSTFAEEFLRQHPMPFLSADLIAAELSPENPTSQRIEAGREFLVRVHRQLELQFDFLVETTLSGRSFRHIVERAKSADFIITIIFVYQDSADMCVARVQERVRKGGHDVPEADIRRRFSRSFANFWHVYRQIADDWHVIYNSGSVFKRVAVGEGETHTIDDESAFHEFLRLAGVNPNDQVSH